MDLGSSSDRKRKAADLIDERSAIKVRLMEREDIDMRLINNMSLMEDLVNRMVRDLDIKKEENSSLMERLAVMTCKYETLEAVFHDYRAATGDPTGTQPKSSVKLAVLDKMEQHSQVEKLSSALVILKSKMEQLESVVSKGQEDIAWLQNALEGRVVTVEDS